MGRISFVLFFLPGYCLSIIGENQIIEKPLIECGDEEITFSIRTLHAFKGSIFIKGQHDSIPCRHLYYDNDQSAATFTVRIGDCGMIRLRQPNGISYKTIFVATFHPQLVTKVDRSYNVHCFYEQASKIVDHFMDIGPMPTESIEKHQTVLPQCSYTVREGGPEGPVARSTNIGKTLVHRWECINPKYGILVRNCIVTDGDQTIKLIDEQGCPLPGELPAVGQLIYDNSLNGAYINIEAFSFAGRTSQQFRCEIKICSKKDGQCEGMTPPNCPNMPRGGYRPNSIIDPDMLGVTKVLGTFQGQFMANTLGNNIMTPPREPTLQIIPEYTKGTPMMNLIPNGMIPDSVEQEPWLQEQNNIKEDKDLLIPLAVVKENSTKIEEAVENISDGGIYLRDDPTEILVKSTTPAADVKHYDSSKEFEQRQRRLADQVIDIESQQIDVASLDHDELEAKPLSAFHDDPLPNQKLTCLNQAAVLTLMVAFGVTTVCTMVFIVYIFSGIVKTHKTEGIEAFSVRSTASCQSEESELPIIFTRRLGQPNYILPVRMP